MGAQLIALPATALLLFCNTWIVAIAYGSSIAVPISRLLIMTGFLFFVCLPLHVIGTRWGRSRASLSSFPCRVHQLKRPIPPKPCGFFPGLILVAGLVPFGCVAVETHFLIQTFWSDNRFYVVYGFILVVLLLFCCVLVCVSISTVYVLLHAEDYRWAWTSVFSCAATCLYVLIYATYYYHHTTMHGLLQLLHFIGAILFFSTCLSCLCAAVGYFGAHQFVILIYRNIKSD